MPYRCLVSIFREKEKKIPTIELKFLYFQRNLEVGNIGNLDRKETKKINQRRDRKLVEHKRTVQFNIHLLSQQFCSKCVETLTSAIGCNAFEEVNNEKIKKQR